MNPFFRAALLFATLGGSYNANGQWNLLDLNTNDDLVGVHYRSDGNVWVSQSDSIQYSLNDGGVFVAKAAVATDLGGAPIIGAFIALHAFDADNAVVTGGGSTVEETIWRTQNAGDGFTLQHVADIGLFDVLNDVEFAQPPLGFAVGTNGRILRSTDEGVTWTAIPSGTTNTLYSVEWVGSSTYLLAGTGTLLRSIDAGLNWSAIPGAPNLVRVVEASGNCFGVSNSGAIWKSTDAGATWNEVGAIPATGTLAALDGNTLLFAGNNELYRSTTTGAYWEVFDLPGYQQINAISFYDAQHGIAVGDDGYAIQTVNAGGPALPIASITPPTGLHCVGALELFQNNGDPAYSYEWSVGGVVAATTYDLSTSFTTPGTYSISLVAYNGFGYDTTATSLTVSAPASVVPFSLFASPDTICNLTPVTFEVPTSQLGVWYRLWRDGSPIGPDQLGNGDTLVFTTPPVTTSGVYTMVATGYSSCGNDTAEVDLPIYEFEGSPGTTFSLVQDSLCPSGSPAILLSNTVPGFSYRWQGTSMGFGDYTVSTGLTLLLPVDTILPPTSGFKVFTIRSSYPGLSCSFLLPGSDTLYLFNKTLTLNITDTTIVEGAQLQFAASAVHLDQFDWIFGPGAIPSAHVGEVPPAVTFLSPGTNAVQLNAMLGDSVCVASVTANVVVVPQVPVVSSPTCTNTSAGGPLFISDVHLDRFNNHYLAGQRWGNMGRGFAMKLDSMGNVLWRDSISNFSSTDWSYCFGITADLEGNAYISGSGGPNTFGYHTVQGISTRHGEFVYKLDRSGKLQWILSSPDLRFRGITCTADNVLHIAGYGAWNGGYVQLGTGENLDVPPGSADPAGGGAFVLDVRPDGSLVGVNTFGNYHHVDSATVRYPIDLDAGTGAPDLYYRADPRIEVSPTGDLLISFIGSSVKGSHVAVLDTAQLIDPVGLDSAANLRQVFMARYEAGTGVTKAVALVGGEPETVGRVSLTGDGGYLLAGRIVNTLVTSDSLISLTASAGGSVGDQQGYIVKADSLGNTLWALSTDGFDPTDIHTDSAGGAYVLGSFTGTGLFASTDMITWGASAGNAADRALLHYDPSGALLDADLASTANHDLGYRMAKDDCGNLHMVTVEGHWSNLYSISQPIHCLPCSTNVQIATIATTGCPGGCYEGPLPGSTDVALEALYLNDVSIAPAGTRDILVDLSSWGTDTAQQIELGYRLNGGPIQTLLWSGSIPYGSSTDSVVLGSPYFGNEHYYVIEAWVHHVNGTADDDQLNDTLRTEQVLCATPLSGTYSLGHPGSDFPTFSAAATTLALCGIDGTTVIEVEDGIYYDEVSLTPIPGVSGMDTVVFRSASNDSATVHLDLLRRTPDNFSTVSLMENVDGVTFEKMGILRSDHLWLGEGAVRIMGGCARVNILNCTITLPRNWLGQGIDMAWLGGGTPRKQMRIMGNTIHYGWYGIGNRHALDSAVMIAGNRLERQRSCGIVSKARSLVIDNNWIHRDTLGPMQSYVAIEVISTAPAPRITRNTILRSTDIPYDGTPLLSWGGESTPGARTLIANNMIMDPEMDDPLAVSLAIDGSNVDIINNTFDHVVSVNAYDGSTDVHLHNNISTADTRAIEIYYGDQLTNFTSDHNVFWPDTALYPYFLRRSSVNYSLAQWTAAFGWDWNSVVTQPSFVAADDLHLAAGNYFNCPSAPLVPIDIDGDARGPVLTRQGADEGDAGVGADAAPAPSATISVLPNPNNGNFMVLDLPDGADRWVVVDASGRAVQQGVCTGATVEIRLDVVGGAYRLNVQRGDRTICVAPLMVIRN